MSRIPEGPPQFNEERYGTIMSYYLRRYATEEEALAAFARSHAEATPAMTQDALRRATASTERAAAFEPLFRAEITGAAVPLTGREEEVFTAPGWADVLVTDSQGREAQLRIRFGRGETVEDSLAEVNDLLASFSGDSGPMNVDTIVSVDVLNVVYSGD